MPRITHCPRSHAHLLLSAVVMKQLHRAQRWQPGGQPWPCVRLGAWAAPAVQCLQAQLAWAPSCRCSKALSSSFFSSPRKVAPPHARRMLPSPSGFPLHPFLLPRNVSGYFFPPFCAVTEIRPARGGGGRAISGSCSYLLCVNPWLGGGEGFPCECSAGRAHIKH